MVELLENSGVIIVDKERSGVEIVLDSDSGGAMWLNSVLIHWLVNIVEV